MWHHYYVLFRWREAAQQRHEKDEFSDLYWKTIFKITFVVYYSYWLCPNHTENLLFLIHSTFLFDHSLLDWIIVWWLNTKIIALLHNMTKGEMTGIILFTSILSVFGYFLSVVMIVISYWSLEGTERSRIQVHFTLFSWVIFHWKSNRSYLSNIKILTIYHCTSCLLDWCKQCTMRPLSCCLGRIPQMTYLHNNNITFFLTVLLYVVDADYVYKARAWINGCEWCVYLILVMDVFLELGRSMSDEISVVHYSISSGNLMRGYCKYDYNILIIRSITGGYCRLTTVVTYKFIMNISVILVASARLSECVEIDSEWYRFVCSIHFRVHSLIGIIPVKWDNMSRRKRCKSSSKRMTSDLQGNCMIWLNLEMPSIDCILYRTHRS